MEYYDLLCISYNPKRVEGSKRVLLQIVHAAIVTYTEQDKTFIAPFTNRLHREREKRER